MCEKSFVLKKCKTWNYVETYVRKGIHTETDLKKGISVERSLKMHFYWKMSKKNVKKYFEKFLKKFSSKMLKMSEKDTIWKMSEKSTSEISEKLHL